MVARLGGVLYWLATSIAVLAFGGTFYAWNYGVVPNNTFGGWFLLFVGVVTWLLGRALRYVLAGR